VPRLILLLAIAVTLVVLIRRAQRQPPHKRRAAYLQIILGAAVVGVVILTLMGKMHWLGAAITGLLVVARQMLPLLIRLLPMLGSLRGQAGSTGSKQSEVSARILTMTLDHDSGDLSGVVLEGPFKDWLLEELDRQQLDELLAYCQREDADSAQLLASYLEQRFPDDETAHERAESDHPHNATGLSRAEALSLLGLEEGATHDEIISAHRTLIQKVHPDRGGSDYLAAKINEAKDFLLD
jgi:hypothetical protein